MTRTSEGISWKESRDIVADVPLRKHHLAKNDSHEGQNRQTDQQARTLDSHLNEKQHERDAVKGFLGLPSPPDLVHGSSIATAYIWLHVTSERECV